MHNTNIHTSEYNNTNFNESRFKLRLEKWLLDIDKSIGNRICTFNDVYISHIYTDMTLLNIVYTEYMIIRGIRSLYGVTYIGYNNINNLFDKLKIEEINDIVCILLDKNKFKKVLVECMQKNLRNMTIYDLAEILHEYDVDKQRLKIIESLNEIFKNENYNAVYNININDIVSTENIKLNELMNNTEKNLFNEPKFVLASNDYAEAFKMLKQKNYKQSITSICIALEGIIKTICIDKGYTITNCRGCSDYLDILCKNNYFDNYIDQDIIGVLKTSIINGAVSIRNKLTAHPKTGGTCIINKETAEYAIYSAVNSINLILRIYK